MLQCFMIQNVSEEVVVGFSIVAGWVEVGKCQAFTWMYHTLHIAMRLANRFLYRLACVKR